MKTKKVKINGQAELEVEEGMSVSEENGVVRVKSVASHLNDMIDGLLAGLYEKWTPQVGEVVKTGEVGRYIMFIYSGVSMGGYPMGYENLYLGPDGFMHFGNERMCTVEEMVPTTREDRIKFFSALEKAGWKYNSKKKELKRVEEVEKWAPKEMKEEKRECEERIAAILNNFVKKWQPSDIDLDVYRLKGDGVLRIVIDIKIEY